MEKQSHRGNQYSFFFSLTPVNKLQVIENPGNFGGKDKKNAKDWSILNTNFNLTFPLDLLALYLGISLLWIDMTSLSQALYGKISGSYFKNAAG